MRLSYEQREADGGAGTSHQALRQSMIALLAKVVQVSVETVAITEAVNALDRSGWESHSPPSRP